MTGSVRLKSNLTIVVSPRAVIRAARNGIGPDTEKELNPSANDYYIL